MGSQYSPDNVADLSIFKDSSLRFPTKPRHRIQSVAVRSLYLDLAGNESEQFIISLRVPRVAPGTTCDFLNRIFNRNNVRLEEAKVSKARVYVTFVPDGRGSAQTSYLEVGYPNHCNPENGGNDDIAKEFFKPAPMLNLYESFLQIMRCADWDWPGACVYADWRLEKFAHGVLDRVIKLGIIKEVARGKYVRCDKCPEGCRIEPNILDSPEGPIGYYVCKQNKAIGGFLVGMNRFRRWEFQFEGLAVLVAKAIQAVGGIKEDVAGRVLFLGTVVQNGTGRDIFLARGLTWSDTAKVLEQATRLWASKGSVVIVPERLPSANLFGETTTTIRSLAEIATVTLKTFKIDMARLLSSDFTVVEPSSKQAEALCKIEMDILEALTANPSKTMMQVEISTTAGYSRSAIQDSLKRLQKLGLIAKPEGTKRKGFALTEKGLTLVTTSG